MSRRRRDVLAVLRGALFAVEIGLTTLGDAARKVAHLTAGKVREFSDSLDDGGDHEAQ